MFTTSFLRGRARGCSGIAGLRRTGGGCGTLHELPFVNPDLLGTLQFLDIHTFIVNSREDMVFEGVFVCAMAVVEEPVVSEVVKSEKFQMTVLISCEMRSPCFEVVVGNWTHVHDVQGRITRL